LNKNNSGELFPTTRFPGWDACGGSCSHLTFIGFYDFQQSIAQPQPFVMNK
jgi:hypothetical protein